MYFFATILTFLSLQPQDEILTHTYQDEDGVFSVRFPGKPTEIADETASGKTKTLRFGKERKFGLVVSVHEFKAGRIKGLTEDEIFEQELAGSETPDFKLESVEVIKKGRIPGRKVIAKARDEFEIVIIAYLIQDKLYTLYAMRDKEDSSKKVVEAFLQSFKLDALPVLFSSESEGFKNRFPAEPVKVEDGLYVKDSTKVMQHISQLEKNKLSIRSVSFPEGYVGRTGRESIFREERRSISVEPFTDLKKYRFLNVGFHRIMEVETSTDIQKTVSTSRYYLVDDRLYVVRVSRKSDDKNDLIQNKFFNSFQITLGNRGRFRLEQKGELFSVEFPYKPGEVKRKPRKHGDGEIQSSLWIAEREGYGFSVSREAYPNALETSEKVKLTAQTVEAMESVFSLKTKNLKVIKGSLFDGSSFSLEGKKSKYLTNVFFADNCLFTISAKVPNGEEWMAQKFLDGFKIKSPLRYKHESKFGGFSIGFPAKPLKKVQKQNGLEVESLVHLEKNNVFFGIASMNLPVNVLEGTDLQKLIEEAKKTREKVLEGKATNARQFKRGSYKGVEYRVENKKKRVTFYCKDYFAGNRFIQLTVALETGKSDWRKDLFFRSLNIKGK